MSITFTDKDIIIISRILETEVQKFNNFWSWSIINSLNQQSIILTIYNHVDFNKGNFGSLISVQSQHGYFELHHPSIYMIFEPDEVIFIQYNNENLSSLIVGRQCTCSMYSNIDRNLLNADFKELSQEVLLSAMQLSIAESAISSR
jgi:hypothetical protein